MYSLKIKLYNILLHFVSKESMKYSSIDYFIAKIKFIDILLDKFLNFFNIQSTDNNKGRNKRRDMTIFFGQEVSLSLFSFWDFLYFFSFMF